MNEEVKPGIKATPWTSDDQPDNAGIVIVNATLKKPLLFIS